MYDNNKSIIIIRAVSKLMEYTKQDFVNINKTHSSNCYSTIASES